jgi:hypothetical protein
MSNFLRTFIFFVFFIAIISITWNCSDDNLNVTSNNKTVNLTDETCCQDFEIHGLIDPSNKQINVKIADNNEPVGYCFTDSHGKCTICNLPAGVLLKLQVVNTSCPSILFYCRHSTTVPITCSGGDE